MIFRLKWTGGRFRKTVVVTLIFFRVKRAKLVLCAGRYAWVRTDEEKIWSSSTKEYKLNPILFLFTFFQNEMWASPSPNTVPWRISASAGILHKNDYSIFMGRVAQTDQQHFTWPLYSIFSPTSPEIMTTMGCTIADHRCIYMMRHSLYSTKMVKMKGQDYFLRGKQRKAGGIIFVSESPSPSCFFLTKLKLVILVKATCCCLKLA